MEDGRLSPPLGFSGHTKRNRDDRLAPSVSPGRLALDCGYLIEPVDPFQRGVHDLFEVSPRPLISAAVTFKSVPSPHDHGECHESDGESAAKNGTKRGTRRH